MNSSAQPSRRIASNLLWTPQGMIRNPLLKVAADGRILTVGTCPAPDRMAATEFHAGILVADFPDDFREAFRQMLALAGTPLPEQLAALYDGNPRPGRALVVVSGLDYGTMRLTAASRIRRIG